MATQRPSLRLPSKRRLKNGQDFSVIRETGKRIVRGCLVLNWTVNETGNPADSRLGVVTSKRVGPAVVRNRARRVMREAFRLNQPKILQRVDLVLVARPSIANKSFASVERDYLAALFDARLISSK